MASDKRLPPHGGSGLKSIPRPHVDCVVGLPPHGGSGLKLISPRFRSWSAGLPPHGGSGLKCHARGGRGLVAGSPSTRREWIEIVPVVQFCRTACVSLHTEGVD